ncbi:MAG: alpha-galactosidase [Synergistaceae bacterium]|nr:alpha-galactosidase [Synergistaceae bacterium]
MSKIYELVRFAILTGSQALNYDIRSNDVMPINYNADDKTFTLHTKNSTYQFQVDKLGFLLHLYYGPKSQGVMDWVLTFADRGFSGSPYDAGEDRTYSLDYLPQEFPMQGTGDYRSPLLVVRNEAGTFGCDLRYKGYEIIDGKYSLEGLPAVYDASECKRITRGESVDNEPDGFSAVYDDNIQECYHDGKLTSGANNSQTQSCDDDGNLGVKADTKHSQTLKIYLEGQRFRVTLLYGVLPEIDIITRAAILENFSDEIITVEKFQTACLDFTHGNFDLITFHGRHMMERQFDRRELHHGSSIIVSRRGMSSHQYNPFMILADHEANETSGQCWAMQFVYSGGFKAEAELDQFNQTRWQIGMAEEKFSYPVKPGEKLIAPEVIMTFSDEGLQKLSHNLHTCIRKHVCRGKYRDTPRPVILNSWEAFYFNFDGEKILELAEQAKSLGVDMLVLDDGWFGDRENDNAGLGDWTPNEKKLGCSLSNLADKVNSLGLKFGLWVEPEMVNEDSNLFREHPDWALTVPGKSPVRGRQQLVLDFSRAEVREYIYRALCKILDTCNIEYLKWDFNRSIADVYSRVEEDQGKVLYDYILGLYDFLERLKVNYPNVLIEGCAGGGGRFDAGMLYYTPQIWCSDNTDAIERLFIHYGTSFAYPMSTISAHVSACPNHQTGRSVSLKTRYVSALTGAFGYELNPSILSEDEKDEIREQIRDYKENSELITNGKYYRLAHEEILSAWEYVSPDGNSAIVCAVIVASKGNMPTVYITPRGLLPGTFYRDKKTGKVYASDALKNIGLPLNKPSGDYESYIFQFERVKA